MEFWKIIGMLGLLVTLVLAGPVSGQITHQDLMNTFQSVNLETARDPQTNQGRKAVQDFLNWKLSSFINTVSSTLNAAEGRNIFQSQTFETTMFVSPSSTQERTVVGTNFIAVFGGRNVTEDEPLVILANYDTEESETNPVDDNGSGVVALVLLAEFLTHQISTGRVDLEKSVVFVASDLALSKYESGLPDNSKTGTEAFIRYWLPTFLEPRKGFHGAVVLDSIMNYNDQPMSQTDNYASFSKAFPLAYQAISERKFSGDFLALVHRDDNLDKPLAHAFERAWRRMTTTLPKVDIKREPSLIKFTYTNHTFVFSTPAATHFLKSEQSPFWNHFIPDTRRTLPTKQLPAILLTDTERYRKTDCSTIGCTLHQMTTPRNLEFMKRTMNALIIMINELQLDGLSNDVTLSSTSSIMVTVGAFLLHWSLTRMNQL